MKLRMPHSNQSSVYSCSLTLNYMNTLLDATGMQRHACSCTEQLEAELSNERLERLYTVYLREIVKARDRGLFEPFASLALSCSK
jgi:hypothetical protein